jgi:FkbM family methyltransferase
MTFLLSAIKRFVFPYSGIMSPLDALQVHFKPRMRRGETRIAGRRVAYSDSTGLLHSAREIFKEQVYRFEARSSRPHIIDAGANIGLSVLYFKTLYPEASILAYEPDAVIFDILEQNTRNLPGVEVRNAAVWNEDTELRFFSEGSLAGSSEINFLGTGKEMVVRAERLKPEIAKRPVDFLKIDIEGAENAVLFDIEDELDNVSNLFFEYHSVPNNQQRLGELLSLVSRRGFRYMINGSHGPELPFVEKRDWGFDLQLNVSCYRP